MNINESLNVFEEAPSPMCVLDAFSPEFKILKVNKAYSQTVFNNSDSYHEKPFFELFSSIQTEVNEAELNRLKQSFQKVISSGQKDEISGLKVERENKSNHLSEQYWKVVNTPVFDDQEKVKYIIHSIFDITAEYLNDRNNRIILENTPEAFMIVDLSLNLINCNATFKRKFENVFGFEAPIGFNVLDFVRPERKKIVETNFQNALKGETVKDMLSFKGIDGTDLFIKAIHKPIYDATGHAFGVFVSMQDVTEKQKVKERLKAEEARFQALVESGNDIIIVFNETLRPKYISPSMQGILGYTKEEAYSLDMMQIVHPEDQAHVEEELHQSIQQPGNTIFVTPARMKHKNGSWRWFDGTITNMLHNPEIRGIVDNFKDITVKVETEQKLKEAKDKLESLIESIEGIIWESEADTLELNYVSTKVEQILGHSQKQWLQEKNFWKNNIHPDDKSRVLNTIRSKINKNKIHELEYRIKKANGEYIWVRDVITVIPKNDGPDILRGIIIDINQQKKLSNLLEEAYRIAKIGNWEYNIKEDNLFWSDFMYELHEFPKHMKPKIEHVLGFYEAIHNSENVTERINKAFIGGATFDKELELTTPKENKKWVRTVGTPEVVDGKCIRVFGSSQDITDRVTAQHELKEAEEKLRNVVEHSTNMFYTHNIDGVLTYVSPQSTYFLGCKPEEAKRRWMEFVTDHPQNELGIQLTQKTIATGEIQQAYELQLKTADNRIIWVEVNEAPLLENGKTTAIVGSLTDITERKKYETQLKESIERYNYVTKATRDAIYDWDIKTNKVIWGEGLKNLFGYDPETFSEIENAWDKHIHPEDFEEFRMILNQALENKSKQRWVHEYRFKKANGAFTYVSETGYIIRDNKGNASRMIGTIRDVSEAVAAKNEIKASLSEKETLLSEIHHRVKNNLAVVSGMMQLQAFEEEDTQLQAKLFDSVARIKTMATVHELLYQSRSFSKLEFSDTVQKLVQNISQTLQPASNIKMEMHCDSIKLNISQAIPASLIINEVLTNTYKHAFNGQADGTITFHLQKKGKQIFIQIKDDGVGFPPDFNPESSPSLGFHLIKVLSEQIQASYTYKNNEAGTLFELSFTKILSK